MNQTLTKEEVQQRVLQNGKPLNMDKFNWDEKNKKFSSNEDGLVIDFKGIKNCTFKTGHSCTFKTGHSCTFRTGSDCMFRTGHSCTFRTTYNCTFTTGAHCIFNTRLDCTFTTGWDCTFKTGSYCTFYTGSKCTFTTGYKCTFDTAYGCTFETEYSCTFNTESNCTFITGSHCTFKTRLGCTFNTGSHCIFNIYKSGYFNTAQCDNNVVIIRNNSTNKIIKLSDLQNNKLAYLSHNNDPIYRDIKNIKIVDNSIMIINSTKQLDQYKIHSTYYTYHYFYRDNPQKIFIAEQDNLFAHGKSIKEAINDLEFKKLSKLGANKHIQRIIKQGHMSPQDYRFITGACKEGTNKFLNDNNLGHDDTKSIDEVIELTKGSYGHDVFIRLLEENGYEIK